MICLYHANCNDGAGAALAVYEKFGDEGNKYIPVKYGENPPEGLAREDVIIVDFSYKREVLVEMSRYIDTLILIDHHKTSEKDLEGIEDELICEAEIIFDMDKSGAVLTWEFFHKNIEVPSLFDYIEDRDLWKFEMGEDTQNIAKGLKLYPDWREWNCLFNSEEFSVFMAEGKAINDFLRFETKQMIQPPSSWQYGSDEVSVSNIPGFMVSDSLNQALKMYPKAPYAVGYFDEGTKRTYSLRSRNGSDVDVSEIAVRFGGGGHKHAAGFSRPKLSWNPIKRVKWVSPVKDIMDNQANSKS